MLIRAAATSISRRLSSLAKHVTGRENMLVWVDCEMTGVENPEIDRLMEIACLITDDNLNVVAEAPTYVLHVDDKLLDSMVEWCRNTHGGSGLTQKCRDSNLLACDIDADLETFVRRHCGDARPPLAGNSVHVDRQFLQRELPRLSSALHTHRIVDVSTIKELAKRWYPLAYENAPEKAMTHRALEDIKESIEELKHYRKTVLK